MSDNRDKKVILFSTRFLEAENKLFCKDNIASPDYCCSPEYLKFFMSDDLPSEVVHYVNNLYCKNFFIKYEDEKNIIFLNNNNYVDFGENIWGKIPGKFDKDDWDGFFSDLGKKSKLYSIEIKNNSSKSELVIKDRTIEGNEDDLKEFIKNIENTSFNNGIALNTDFGEAIKKISIDRRFKIYKLKDCNVENVQTVYGVWCLKEKSEEKKWYKALYEELKTQMRDDFNLVTEVMFFLHDGDIGEKKPFEVKYYKEDKKTFDFLDDEKSLSVAIFQHSLSDIATVLSNSKIESAIEKALEDMEKGGKWAFLSILSDYIAYWPSGGREKYVTDVKEKKEKYNLNTLLSGENDSVEDVYKKIKNQIDNL